MIKFNTWLCVLFGYLHGKNDMVTKCIIMVKYNHKKIVIYGYSYMCSCHIYIDVATLPIVKVTAL